jgi:STE24 endopeptidase
VWNTKDSNCLGAYAVMPLNRILFTSKMFDYFTSKELQAIFADEVGHHKLKHGSSDIKTYTFRSLTLFISFFPILYLTYNLYPHWDNGLRTCSILFLGIVLFRLSIGICKLILFPSMRKNEYEADAYSVLTNSKKDLKNSLLKLGRLKKKIISPSRIDFILNYSHPTLAQRVEAIESLE